jgi:hypothetical protein
MEMNDVGPYFFGSLMALYGGWFLYQMLPVIVCFRGIIEGDLPERKLDNEKVSYHE